MRLLGKVLHLTAREIIVKGEKTPKLGITAVNSKNRTIGRIYEIFGPINSPYISIRPASGFSKKDLEGLVGADVFMGEAYVGRRGKKGRP
ncbi:MAG: Gar1/Naf1 family protein [Candidatus Hadarchaeota archaeon]